MVSLCELVVVHSIDCADSEQSRRKILSVVWFMCGRRRVLYRSGTIDGHQRLDLWEAVSGIVSSSALSIRSVQKPKRRRKSAKDDETRRITYTVDLQLINRIQLIELIQFTEIALQTFSLIVRVCKKCQCQRTAKVGERRRSPKHGERRRITYTGLTKAWFSTNATHATHLTHATYSYSLRIGLQQNST